MRSRWLIILMRTASNDSSVYRKITVGISGDREPTVCIFSWVSNDKTVQRLAGDIQDEAVAAAGAAIKV